MQPNTPEWLEYRKNKIGASDAPIIMGTSPWMTKYQLWQEKLGLAPQRGKTAAMQRGLDLEEKARSLFIEMTGIKVIPKVMENPHLEWMIASLDGIDSENKNIVEIKCVNREDHRSAEAGIIPDKYFPQLQHQMEVCAVEMAHYFSFDGNQGVCLHIYRDDQYIKKLLKAETDFWECMQNLIVPELTDKDYELIHSPEWEQTASEWILIQEKVKEIEFKEKALREKLISLSKNKNSMGSGIKVCKTARKGNVDYAKIPELFLVDLEPYRKPAVEYWKILKAS